MALISKNIMAALLLITIIISAVGTWAAISSLAPYEEVPVVIEPNPVTGGRVSAYVRGPPPVLTGEVTVNVLPSKEGG